MPDQELLAAAQPGCAGVPPFVRNAHDYFSGRS